MPKIQTIIRANRQTRLLMDLPPYLKYTAAKGMAGGSEFGSRKIGVGGGRGIRTPESLSTLTVFKTGAFNHSAIPPITMVADVRPSPVRGWIGELRLWGTGDKTRIGAGGAGRGGGGPGGGAGGRGGGGAAA